MNTPLTSAPQQSRETWLAMAGLALALFLVSLDQTVVGTSMPKIIAELNGFSLYAWVATIYLLAETVTLPIAGKLGDIYGRKWITIGGVGLFIAASAFCGMANSMEWLIAGRGIQGIGAGIIIATVFTLVADIFPDMRDRARHQGTLFAVFALSSIVGPPLGGWLTDSVGWRWIFYINLPLGLLAVVALPHVLPQGTRRPHVTVDYAGAIAISVAVIALLLSLELTGMGYAWDSMQVVGGLLLALMAFALFIPLEQRASDPVIPLGLFKNRTVAATITVMTLFGAVMFGLILYSPLFIQAVCGLSASQSGLVMLPMSIAIPIVGIVVGQVVARTGSLQPFIVGGAFLVCMGVFLMTTVQADTHQWLIAAYLLVAAVGMGSILPVSTLLVQTAAPRSMIGVATATTQFVRLIGSTVGTAAIGVLVTSGYGKELAAHLPAGEPVEVLQTISNPNALVSADALNHLSALMASQPNGEALLQGLLDAARGALTLALHHGFLLMLFIMLLALACSLLIGKVRLAEHKPASEEGLATAH